MAVKFINNTSADKKTIKKAVTAAISAGTKCANSNHKFFITIDPNLLAIDDAYQTEDRQSHYAGLSVDIWDWDKYLPIQVSFRNGYLFVFEGGHRVKTALQMGCKTIDAILYTGLTQAREIELFVHQCDNRAKLSVSEKFYAQLNADNPDPIIVDIYNIMLKHGYCIANRSMPRNLNRINAAAKFIEKYVALYMADFETGHAACEWYFEMLNRVIWTNQPKATSKEYIVGFYEVWKEHYYKGTLDIAERNLRKILTFMGTSAIGHEADRHFLRKGNFEARVESLLMSISYDRYVMVTDRSYIDPEVIIAKDERFSKKSKMTRKTLMKTNLRYELTQSIRLGGFFF